ncbi:NUDIX hydrolase [Sphingomonas sp. RG327]|jgi:ADP-ribose pyrophosphatase|uniref:GDP-mannose pyrophosphatase n=1 Tax=Sphingomonas anseongensis TaxID=2908207 RepID=A0ABT0RDU5_9SPHN|nr:NUDIX hydrolase [Sphingomonas anseongensis]MCL6678411.1 NUDIX hydrolase [Sphingomonas anseongensis]
MTPDSDAPLETMWAGKYISVFKRGRWEYVSRTGSTNAVVILAEHEGKVILIEQYRVPVGGRCLELPAGLVGDEDEHATVEGTAVKELEEETGFTCDRVERLGEFHSSPGMVAESFTLVRAHGVRRVGDGGGNEHEDITVHLVPRDEIPEFIRQRRDAGSAVDVKLLLFLDA